MALLGGMMKVIFLDVDGVLNSKNFMAEQREKLGQEWLDTRGIRSRFKFWADMLDPVAIERLNKILEATGAVCVLSSTWRISNDVPTMMELLNYHGFRGKIISGTPRFPGGNRGVEIKFWLENNCINEGFKPVEKFVILDDDSDMCDLMLHLVHTSWETGLQDEHVEECITRLGEQNETGRLGQGQ